MKQSILTLLLVGLISFCVLTPAVNAQDAAGETIDATKAEFDAAFADYKKTITEIEDLRVKFQAASRPERESLNAELKALVVEAQVKMQGMVNIGLEIYKADPAKYPAIEKLLTTVAEHYAMGKYIDETAGNFSGGDQYELALPVLQGMIESGKAKDEYYIWAFVAAVVTNDYNTAEQYLKTIIEKGLLDAGPPANDQATGAVWKNAYQFAGALPMLKESWEKEIAIRKKEAEADNLPRVKMETSKGTIVIELYEDQAPIATANFLSLVKKGFYDGIVFHRVLQGFMAQGGDPDGTGSGGPGYEIPCETDRGDIRKHFRGTLSMAHAGKDTGGSQFFLCFTPQPGLDGRHTAFGRVIEGMEVLGDIQRIDPMGKGAKAPADKIVKATVIRDRGHSYEFPKSGGR